MVHANGVVVIFHSYRFSGGSEPPAPARSLLETAAAKAAMQAESTVSGDGRRKRSSPPRTPQDPDSARGKGGKGKPSQVEDEDDELLALIQEEL